MHGEDKRPRRLPDGKSRARILLKKNAGWLPGFPLPSDSGPLRWQAWPWEHPGTGRVVSLEGGALRRMEMTLTKLRYHFPQALPQIVEDVDDWLARMDYLLRVLKEAIHQRRPIDVQTLLAAPFLSARWAERFGELRAAQPHLAGLLDAVAFLEFTGRSRLDSSVLKWIADHTTPFSRFGGERAAGDELPLTLCTLREDIHADLVPLLLDCVTDASVSSAPTCDAYAYAQRLSDQLNRAANAKRFKIPEETHSSTIGEAWRGFLRRLLTLDPKARRQATALLGLLLPADFAAAARVLAEHVEGEESRLLRRLRQVQYERPKLFRTRAERKQLKRQAEVVVADHANVRLLEHTGFAISHIPAILDESLLLRHWLRLAKSLPMEERLLRVGLFARWGQARLQRHDPRQANRRFQQLAPELCRLFGRRGVHPVVLHRLREFTVSRERYASDPVGGLLETRYGGRETYRRWTRLVEATVYDRDLPLGAELLDSLGEFALATSNTDRAARLVAVLAESEDEYFDESEIRVALALAKDDSEAAAILRRFSSDYEMIEPAGLLGRHVADRQLRRVITQWVLNGQKKSLLRLACCTQMVVALDLSVPKAPEAQSPPVWLARYPSELHGLLKQLHRIAPDARAIADGLLRKEFPDPDDLQRELEALGHQLNSPAVRQDVALRRRLQRRSENLQRRIDRPRTVTPRRLERLVKKIGDRLDYERVERYVRECYAATAEKMKVICGGDRVPEELFAPPKDQLISGILQLAGVMKDLGLQLLLKSQHDPRCDFRSEPPNAMFLQAIREKGIRLEPWLSDSFQRTAKTADGEPYRLFFAREILDVLLMGFHFETCLSPGAANFFSTIANALDINKQVVYGKTESGRVVGRCLFALADNGTILTYHRYAHHEADGFQKEVNQFAEQLAKAMGTALASTGRVATLVAKSWYDDGAMPSESVYDFQNPEGLVRTVLRTEDVSEIPKKLVEFFGCDEALKSVLGSLLQLEEFQQRNEIVGPLLERFGFDVSIPFPVRLRLAVLARLAGSGEVAGQIVRSLRIGSLPRRLKRFACRFCETFHGIGSYREVLDLLIECNPSIALRTLRITRPQDVKSDAEETSPVRRKLLMRCHRLLGRGRPVSG
ncbi:MAG: hypothetical protein JXB62_08475 [Pirellulales bacterium]|nr:hypothetical protein [Pirellulales bacterium]